MVVGRRFLLIHSRRMRSYKKIKNVIQQTSVKVVNLGLNGCFSISNMLSLCYHVVV